VSQVHASSGLFNLAKAFPVCLVAGDFVDFVGLGEEHATQDWASGLLDIKHTEHSQFSLGFFNFSYNVESVLTDTLELLDSEAFGLGFAVLQQTHVSASVLFETIHVGQLQDPSGGFNFAIMSLSGAIALGAGGFLGGLGAVQAIHVYLSALFTNRHTVQSHPPQLPVIMDELFFDTGSGFLAAHAAQDARSALLFIIHTGQSQLPAARGSRSLNAGADEDSFLSAGLLVMQATHLLTSGLLFIKQVEHSQLPVAGFNLSKNELTFVTE
jgi:hypothetical protein